MTDIKKYSNQQLKQAKQNILPLVPLRDLVVLPNNTIPVFVGRDQSIKALLHAMDTDKKIFLTTQKNPEVLKPDINHIYQIGTLAHIVQPLKLSDGTIKVLVQGEKRAKIIKLETKDDFLIVHYELIQEQTLPPESNKAAILTLTEEFVKYAQLSKTVTNEFLKHLATLKDDESIYADAIASQLPLKTNDKQKLLECYNIEERFLLLLKLLHEETQVFTMSQKIKGRVKEQMKTIHKKHYLNEQIRAIKKEMGEDGTSSEHQELKQKLKNKKISKEASKVVKKELEKLKMMSPMSSEATVVRNYIDWLLCLPWFKKSRAKIDIKKAEHILDEDHYGLKKPKVRILEYLAVQILVNKIKGPILCFVGPPGVGKTSLAKSIATATTRSFARISLGGIRDEAEIRGHRRTYVGAMPGKIIQTLKKTGYNNPVFCLDEIDKMTMDFRGDPSSALLEALDPEQNKNFNDHYLEVDYDLSQILFITTANTLFDIPAPLKDRMEIIQIPGYTQYEKLKIAIRHLVPKQLSENGLTKKDVVFSNNALKFIIQNYTKEAGVRNLEQNISSVLRKIAKEIVQTKTRKLYKVSIAMAKKFLGQPKFRDSALEKEDKVGFVQGLAWTQAGGVMLTIEAVTMPGKGNVLVTGKLGDVMKESSQAAVSYVRSRSKELKIKENFYKNLDIHIHVPEGAIPKDGPSAGITMCTAVVSILSGKPVSKDIAMTGEITLRGRVLPVGGLKEKLLAAHSNKIKKVIVSKQNKRDIKEVPKTIQRQLEIIYADDMSEVLKYALV